MQHRSTLRVPSSWRDLERWQPPNVEREENHRKLSEQPGVIRVTRTLEVKWDWI